MGRGAGLRTGTGRVQTPGQVRSPVSFDHLSFPLGAVALRGGDNMLDGRPRDPDLLRDRRGPESGLECGEDQPFLSGSHVCGPSWLIRFCTPHFRWGAHCRPAPHRWTVRRIASAPPDLVSTAFVSRSSWASSSRRKDRPRSAGRAIFDLPGCLSRPGPGAGVSGARRGALSFPVLRAMTHLPVLPLCRADSSSASQDLHRLRCER